jgi:hypothetical protein
MELVKKNLKKVSAAIIAIVLLIVSLIVGVPVLFPPTPPTGGVETRYMRGDTQTINGLLAYILGTTQSAITTYTTKTCDECDFYWGIQVWKRASGGAETEITPGYMVAVVNRYAIGSGIQSNTWTCPQTVLLATDAIVVRVYIQDYVSTVLQVTFITTQLTATQLDAATWTVYYYTKVAAGYVASFYWGNTATYNSYISGFSWSNPADSTPPTYALPSPSYNTTTAGQPCMLSVSWNDNTNVSQASISHNNTGAWTYNVSVTFVWINTTGVWANYTLSLNNSVGIVVGWYQICNDTTNNFNNTGMQTLTTTAAPPTYYGNSFGMDYVSTELWDLTTSTKAVSYRFTCEAAQTLKEFLIYVYSYAQCPTYNAGLQFDSSGIPSGSWLTSTTVIATTTGWFTINTPDYAIVAGMIYHIVITYNSGTIDATHHMCLTFGHHIHPATVVPLNCTTDSSLNTCTRTTSSWSITNYEPILLLTPVSGNISSFPYSSVADKQIYGNYTYGERFIPQNNINVGELGAYAMRYGAPEDYCPLTVVLYNQTGSAEICRTNITGTSIDYVYSWVQNAISNVTLKAGLSYYLYYKAYESVVPHRYQIQDWTATSGSSYTWQGTNDIYIYSTDGGSTWSNVTEDDIDWRIRYSADPSPPIIGNYVAGDPDATIGNYTAYSIQNKNWMYFNYTLTDGTSVVNATVEWWNGTTWGNNSLTHQASTNFWYQNFTSLSVNTWYGYNFYAIDSESNWRHYHWTKEDLTGGGASQAYVKFSGTPINVSYNQPYYFFNLTYDRIETRLLPHSQKSDGSIWDAGLCWNYTPVVQQLRWCSLFTRWYFDENVTINQTLITNFYLHVWWANANGSMGAQFSWGKSFDGTTSSDQWLVTNATAARNMTITDGNYSTYWLNAERHDIAGGYQKNFTSNDIYSFLLQVMLYDMSTSPMSVVSPVSDPSFIIFNLPSNATLQTWDSDGDGRNDFVELYTYFTNPFYAENTQLAVGWNNFTAWGCDVGKTLSQVNASLYHDSINYSQIGFEYANGTRYEFWVDWGGDDTVLVTADGKFYILCNVADEWGHYYP